MKLERTAAGIINAAFGYAGERCMALPVIVVQESIADALVAAIVKKAKALKVGPAYKKDTDMGPVVTDAHCKFVTDWINKGVYEGAKVGTSVHNDKLGKSHKIKIFSNRQTNITLQKHLTLTG